MRKARQWFLSIFAGFEEKALHKNNDGKKGCAQARMCFTSDKGSWRFDVSVVSDCQKFCKNTKD